jgi:hypothetical protein
MGDLDGSGADGCGVRALLGRQDGYGEAECNECQKAANAVKGRGFMACEKNALHAAV